MKRREFYRLVAECAAGFDGKDSFLAVVIDAMRAIRGGSNHSAGAINPALLPVLQSDDALGRIYQALSAPELERAYRGTTRERRKFSEAEIPAVTQLFTPRFVVEFLLKNTLGRINKRVRDIRILDPACGTMNFGIVAIEMLAAMYRQELTRLGPGEASVASEDQIPAAIARENLFGIDIDPTALELAAQTLSMKLGLPVAQCRQNLWCGDALMDRELEARCLGAFDVVVTNPPYLSARNLHPARVARVKKRFPASSRDAYACFIERSLQFSREGGYVGILAMQSFMFTAAFEKLRKNLGQIAAIETIAHFGPGLFGVGNPGTLQTAAVVLRRESDAVQRGQNDVNVIRLVHVEDKEAGLTEQREVFTVKQHQLLSSPRSAWIYWMTPAIRRAFDVFPKLKQIAEPRQGLATTDNARFVRYWWEIEPTRRDAPCRATPDTWFAYVKSGRFRRWFESPRHRVNWADDGRAIKQSIQTRYPYLNGRWEWVAKNSQFYGRGGVTYSYLTAGAFSARLMPPGAIFDVAGSAMFPKDSLTLLAVLNSTTAQALLGAINPTVNFQVGDLAELPVPCETDETLHELASRAAAVQRTIESHDETSPEFVSPQPWRDGSDNQLQLSRIETEINSAVARLYGMSNGAKQPFRESSIDRRDVARRWIGFAIGRLLGRWGCEREIERLQLRPACEQTVGRIRDELTKLAPDVAKEIEQSVDGIESFLAGPFYAWHVKLYRYRPIYWALSDNGRTTLWLHDFATADAMSRIVTVPKSWERSMDDGIAINLASFCECAADTTLARKLREIRSDLQGGRLDWSRTASAISSEAPNRGSASRYRGRSRGSGRKSAART